jgi:hypothetical protein
MPRTAIAALIGVITVTSGFAGGIAYVCMLDGQARSRCCCDHSATDQADVAIAAADDCCEVQVSNPTQISATADGTSFSFAPLPVLATMSSSLPALSAALGRAVRQAGARGPPYRASVPIFISNCSYLI